MLTRGLLLALLLLATTAISRAEGDLAIPVVTKGAPGQSAIPDPCPLDRSPTPARFMISWNDTPAIDGSFVFVVNPTQLLLRSFHDNPNPNRLYWLQSITPPEYEQLVTYLKNYRGDVFSDRDAGSFGGYKVFQLIGASQSPWHPEQDSPADDERWRAAVDKTILKNLNRVIREINRGMKASGIPQPSTLLELDERVELIWRNERR